jgi:hypothetical protein
MAEDPMRVAYKQLTGEELAAVNAVKSAGNAIFEVIKLRVPDGRAQSLAITNLEQAVMWAVKGITG